MLYYITLLVIVHKKQTILYQLTCQCSKETSYIISVYLSVFIRNKLYYM